MPSTSSAPSASRSRTPLAAVTTSGGRVPGMGAYGCQTRCLSSSRIFSGESTKNDYLERKLAAGAGPADGLAALAALFPQPHGHLDRGALEAELLAQPPFDEPAVGLLEDSGGEQHEVRRLGARLRGEQDPRLAAAAHRRRGGRDQLVQERVELPGGDALLPARQGLLDGGDQLLDVPAGGGGDVHPGRPARLVELPVDLPLQVVAALLVGEIPLVVGDHQR